MVRMSQPFVNNLPLIDGHGNWGSIDGDGAAAMRYCVTGDTLINTNKGLLRIDEIVKNSELNSDNDIDLEIKSKEGKNNKTSKLFNSGEHLTYTITLKNGMKLRCSENHPVLVLNKNFETEWKLAKDLKGNEKCAIDLNRTNVLFGTHNDILEARMLGAIIPNGYNKAINKIGLYSRNEEIVLAVKEFCEKKIKNKEIIENKTNLSKLFIDGHEYFVLDEDFYNDFKKEYDYKSDREKQEIPKQVFLGTKEYQKEFLKYLFESRGRIICDVNPFSKKEEKSFFYHSTSERFINQLQIILATQFGIYTKKKRNKEYNDYRLYIHEDYLKIYKEEIGFVSKFKNKKLDELINIYSKKNNSKKYKEINNYLEQNGYLLKRKINSKDKLNLFKKYLLEKDFNYCEKILEGYEYVKIDSINKNKKPEVVYSIKVDSECHSFVGNGFINHNTECRLEKVGNELIDGLKEKIVPFQPNFDEEEIEPIVLPARFPNLLVNGTNGIAVGLVSSIPPHNLKDSIDMITYYMKKITSKNKDVTIAELLDILKGPDFPTGGSIVNAEDLLEIYKTGEGKIFIRAKLEEETINGKPCLIVTKIPYTFAGSKTSLIDKISKIILSKKIEELIEIRDESSKEGLRIVIECKKGSDLEKVSNKLYKFTPLQDTMTIRFNGTIGKELKPFNLLDYCKYFTDFQEEIYTNEYIHLKQKLEKKKEIYEGLVKALDFIDVIIDLIRHAEKVEYAKRCLMTGNVNNIKFQLKKNESIASKFNFTEIQAESILETTLRKLNNLEITAISETLAETNKKIVECDKILSKKTELHKIIINRLNKIAKEYGTERKTLLTTSKIIEYKEEPKLYEMNIIFDRYGYIKCFDEKLINKVDESILEGSKINLKTNNTDNLWCFSSDGFMYQVKLKELVFNKLNDRGTLLESKIGKKIEGDIILVSNQNTEGKLIFVTEKGFIKIVDKKEFISTRAITSSTKLNENDKIIKIIEIKDEDMMIICSEKNYLNFKISEISELKKTSVGIVSIKITDKEKIKDVQVYNSKTNETISLNKIIYDIKTLKIQKRGSKGTKI